ncbi:MAG: dephospho-CoA kinase [Firmicutes bacterium]|nr:dephospho-CoA kinase [Bacillota bacterium]
MSRIIGLTGQIGSGKSLVASILREMGAVVIEADALARQVVEPGCPALTEICTVFGAEYVLPEGSLNRKALSQIIFSDAKARNRLNAIMHPLIRKEAEYLIDRFSAAGEKMIILEAAILISGGFTDMVDEIWLITAPIEQIYDRLAQRDGLNEAEITQRLTAQLSPQAQTAFADNLIINDGDVQKLRKQLEKLI